MNINKNSAITVLLSIINRSDKNSVDFVLAKYFLEHIFDMQHLNVFDISQECFVDRSSIRRFCKKYGFENFKEFKLQMKVILDSRSYMFSYLGSGNYCTLLEQQFSEMLHDMNTLFTKDILQKLAKEIYASDKVYILVSDFSRYACEKFQRSMLYANKILYVLSNHYEDILYNTQDKQNLVLTFSVTGHYARDIIEIVQDNNQRNYLFTTNRDPFFTKYYNKIYYLSTEEHVNKRSVFSDYSLEVLQELIFNEYMNYIHREDRGLK